MSQLSRDRLKNLRVVDISIIGTVEPDLESIRPARFGQQASCLIQIGPLQPQFRIETSHAFREKLIGRCGVPSRPSAPRCRIPSGSSEPYEAQAQRRLHPR